MAWAQDATIKIEAGKRIEVTIPGAIIAFSRRSANARVLADDGSVYIAARQPGETQLVVLTPTKVLKFNLVVGDNKAPSLIARKPIGPPKRVPATRQKIIDTPPEQVISSVDGEQVPLKELSVQPVAQSGAIQAEVQAGRTLQIKVSGATGALSVDSELLDASAADGVVNLTGRAPGRAEVLIVSPDGLKNIFVLVSPSPPSYPPGFVSPTALTDGAETCTYEFRFASDPRQVQDRLDYTIRKPGLTTQLHFINIDFMNGMGMTDESRTTLPSGFYRISTPSWDLTMIDEPVKNSPLTIDGVIVRGIHFRSGDWIVHAGYSSLASFANFLIPTQREGALGISHVFKPSPNSELSQNAYYFPTPPKANITGQPGGIGSVGYKLHRPQGLQMLGEIGFSHGLGAAGDLQWSDKSDFLHIDFREKPPNFASLSVANLPGSVAESAWTRKLSTTLTGNANFSENHLILPNVVQTNLTSTSSLQYKFSPRWSLSSGVSYADFSQSNEGARSSVHSLSLPQQINFDMKTFGAGFQYQLTRTSGSLSLGEDLRGTARFSRGALQFTAFAERQTDALTVNSLYSQIPSLQLELQRLGLTAIQPSQLMSLLQDNAFLLALGYSQQTTLNLVPVRVQLGASLNWTSQGSRPSRLSLDFTRSQEQSLQADSNNWIQSGSYTKSLSAMNELFLSYSWFHYAVLGQTQVSPQLEIGLRHSFSTLPSFLNPGAHGTLTGLVFEDDERRGIYDSHMRTLSGVDLVLDGWQHTQTNTTGRYVFSHIPAGTHTIEAKFHSTLPYWYTTPSVASVTINTSTDFGITFAASELIGYVKNDAGLAIPNAEIEISDRDTKMTQTDADGRFAVSGLAPGEYQLAIDPNSVPAGYVLEELTPLHVHLEKGSPQNAEFRLRAIRTLSGEVTFYDPQLGRYAPLAEAIVAIPKLSLQVKTNRLGMFVLHDLPAGDYTLNIVDGGRLALTREISIPAEPAELQETFRIPQIN